MTSCGSEEGNPNTMEKNESPEIVRSTLWGTTSKKEPQPYVSMCNYTEMNAGAADVNLTAWKEMYAAFHVKQRWGVSV